MGDKTPIEWCDASWNCLAAFDRETGKRGWFCTRVSDGCKNCYAAVLNQRLGTGHDYQLRNLEAIEFRLVNLDQPLRWKRPRRIFVNSMTDLFHGAVPDEMIDQVFAAMALAHWHTHQVLTKRPERAAEYLLHSAAQMRIALEAGHEDPHSSEFDHVLDGPWPLPNVWIGTSVEDQAAADQRIPHLLRTPAAVRFLSLEPLLGPLDLRLGRGDGPIDGIVTEAGQGIHWIIVGGESGPRARPMHPGWARSLRDQAQAAGVAFHFKQWGEWEPRWPFEDDRDVLDAASRPRRGHHGYDTSRVDVVPVDPRVRYFEDIAPGEAYVMERVGKKKAGRLLDGRTWDEFPDPRS